MATGFMSEAQLMNLPFNISYSPEFSTSPSEDDSQPDHNSLAEEEEDGLPLEDSSSTSTNFLSSENGQLINDADVKKKKRPPSTAAKRATHNAIERARRESLNGRFLELASALPNMSSVKRPSKSSIVIKSLEFVYEVTNREKILLGQNDTLLKELNELRTKLGLPLRPASPSLVPLNQLETNSLSGDKKKKSKGAITQNQPNQLSHNVSTPFDYGFPPLHNPKDMILKASTAKPNQNPNFQPFLNSFVPSVPHTDFNQGGQNGLKMFNNGNHSPVPHPYNFAATTGPAFNYQPAYPPVYV